MQRRLLIGVLLLLSVALSFAEDERSMHAARRAAEKRCRGTTGGWCGPYLLQQPLGAWPPPPRGDKECPSGCNGVGNCNYDTGLCECPAGWQGTDCATPLKRPCTNRFRDVGEDEPRGHIDAAGRDLDPTADGYTESRCIGICDDNVARCFCDGKYAPVPAPPGSPPGSPPLRRGRPLGNHLCQPSDDGKGNALPWGQVPWQDLYGPQGWCQAEAPKFECGCMYDGFGGPLCDQVLEQYCPNQCSGHGECDQGFCRCHKGWYGTDCARLRAGMQEQQGLQDRHPWLKSLVHMPQASQRASTAATTAAGSSSSSSRGINPSGTSSGSSGGSSSKGIDGSSSTGGSKEAGQEPRVRPLIYIYDLPPAYNARMLQYRVEKSLCVWRAFHDGNTTAPVAWTYAIEPLFHEMLLQSKHRTFDPEEADFFYMPLYTSCFIFPIHCWADGPWWYSPSGPRVMHVTNMMLEARDWVRTHFPYWNRRGGRDHIWLMTHDEGACYAPTEIYNSSIFLTHWGRTDLHHSSNTAFTPDNYTQEWDDAKQPGGWLRLIRGHPCYTPGKDLVIPSLKFPHHFSSSPLLAAPPQRPMSSSQRGSRSHRDILAFFRGDVGKHRLPHYSRGVRQRLHQLCKERGWDEKYKVQIGDSDDFPGSYSALLARSKFCLVLPGDGWSARAEDAVLHGCVPVVIMDQVNAVFEPELDWKSFSIRLREDQVEQLPELLMSVPPQVFKKMQAALRLVWHRFAYTSHPLLSKPVDDIIRDNLLQWAQERRRGRRRRGRLLTEQQDRAEAWRVDPDARGTGLADGGEHLPGMLNGGQGQEDENGGGAEHDAEEDDGGAGHDAEDPWEDEDASWLPDALDAGDSEHSTRGAGNATLDYLELGSGRARAPVGGPGMSEPSHGLGAHAPATSAAAAAAGTAGIKRAGADLAQQPGHEGPRAAGGPGCLMEARRSSQSLGQGQSQGSQRMLASSSGAGSVDDDVAILAQRRRFAHEDDAFHTIMQWLYHRIQDTGAQGV